MPWPRLCLALALLGASLIDSSSQTHRRCLPPNDEEHYSVPDELRVRFDSWPTSELTANVALILLTEKLGFDGAILSPGNDTDQTYDHLGDGLQHVAFEIWRSSEKQASFDRSAGGEYGLEDAPSTALPYFNVIAEQKWYEVRPRYPSLLTDALFQEAGRAYYNQSALPFANWTPTVCASGGCVHQLFHPDPAYMKGQHESKVEELGLPLTIAYTGLEALEDQVWEAHHLKRGALFYWWSPSTRIRDLRISDFDEVLLPRSYEWPHHRIEKAYSQKLSGLPRGGDVRAFVRAFELSMDDYQELAKQYWESNNNAWEAACAFVRLREEVWSSWIVFPDRHKVPFTICHESGPCSVECWVLLFVQVVILLLGPVLFYYIEHHKPRKLAIRARLTDVQKMEMVSQAMQESSERQRGGQAMQDPERMGSCISDATMLRKVSRIMGDMVSPVVVTNPSDPFRKVVESMPAFLRYYRSEENFVRSQLDPNLFKPPTNEPYREVLASKRKVMYRYLFFAKHLRGSLVAALWLGMLSGAVGTLCWLIRQHEDFRSAASDSPDGFTAFLEEYEESISTMIDTFKFFPTFMLLGYMTYSIGRWRLLLHCTMKVIGKLHDIGLHVGGAVVNPKSEAHRRLVFVIYRLTNTAHLLAYTEPGWTKHPWLTPASDPDMMVKTGLVTPAECALLKSTIPRKRFDLVLTWISSQISHGMMAGVLHDRTAEHAHHSIAAIRATATKSTLSDVENPNGWSSLMRTVTDLLVVLFVAGSPAICFDHGQCIQFVTMGFTVLLSFPLLACNYILNTIHTPFLADSVHEKGYDIFNVAGMLQITDRTLFTTLRAKFDFPYEAYAAEGRQAVAEPRQEEPQAYEAYAADEQVEQATDKDHNGTIGVILETL